MLRDYPLRKRPCWKSGYRAPSQGRSSNECCDSLGIKTIEYPELVEDSDQYGLTSEAESDSTPAQPIGRRVWGEPRMLPGNSECHVIPVERECRDLQQLDLWAASLEDATGVAPNLSLDQIVVRKAREELSSGSCRNLFCKAQARRKKFQSRRYEGEITVRQSVVNRIRQWIQSSTMWGEYPPWIDAFASKHLFDAFCSNAEGEGWGDPASEDADPTHTVPAYRTDNNADDWDPPPQRCFSHNSALVPLEESHNSPMSSSLTPRDLLCASDSESDCHLLTDTEPDSLLFKECRAMKRRKRRDEAKRERCQAQSRSAGMPSSDSQGSVRSPPQVHGIKMKRKSLKEMLVKPHEHHGASSGHHMKPRGHTQWNSGCESQAERHIRSVISADEDSTGCEDLKEMIMQKYQKTFSKQSILLMSPRRLRLPKDRMHRSS